MVHPAFVCRKHTLVSRPSALLRARAGMQADAVTRGPDPRVHRLRKSPFAKWMDCRVEPGNDSGETVGQAHPAQRIRRVSYAKSHVDTHSVQEPNMRQRPSRKNGRHTRPTRGNAMR